MRHLIIRYGAIRPRNSVLSPPSFHTSTKARSSGVINPTDHDIPSWDTTDEASAEALQPWTAELDARADSPSPQSWYNRSKTSLRNSNTSKPQSVPKAATDDTVKSLAELYLGRTPARRIFGPPPISRLPYLREDPCSLPQAKSKVKLALHQSQPYILLPALLKTLHDPAFVQSLPMTTFHEIIRLLDAKYFLQRIRDLHREVHPAQNIIYGDSEPQMQEIFDDYVVIIKSILQCRKDGGHKLGVEEYRTLLKTLSYAGYGKAAWQEWKRMKEEDVKPDLECYNSYLEARCWSYAYHPAEAYKLRVIPMTMKFRRPPLSEYSRRLPGYRVGFGGLKAYISKTFVEMIEDGIMADSRSFSLLMTALAKEGDLAGVKSILKHVWDVDADNLAEVDEDPQSPNGLSRQSPLFPNDQVLWTIANLFGSNNDIPTALRVVDYFSRRYSIVIPPRVWRVLLEWTFVLSKRRPQKIMSGSDWTGLALGQLPLQSVERLWNTMISEPYNIKPTLFMYDRYVRNLSARQMLYPLLAQASKGISLYWSLLEQYTRLGMVQSPARASQDEDSSMKNDVGHNFVKESPSFDGALTSITKSPNSPDLRYAEAVLRLDLIRHFATISRWLRLLLRECKWLNQSHRTLLWERRLLPKVIRKMWLFRPSRRISYEIATGYVNIIMLRKRGLNVDTGIFDIRMRPWLNEQVGGHRIRLESSKSAHARHTDLMASLQPREVPNHPPGWAKHTKPISRSVAVTSVIGKYRKSSGGMRP